MRRSAMALLSCCLILPAQQDSKKDLVISTTTQLVVEDVLIKGKDGKPVVGLKPSDFTITEDGKPQRISIFEFQTLEEEPASGPTFAARPTAEPAAPAPAPEKSTVKPLTNIQIAPKNRAI